MRLWEGVVLATAIAVGFALGTLAARQGGAAARLSRWAQPLGVLALLGLVLWAGFSDEWEAGADQRIAAEAMAALTIALSLCFVYLLGARRPVAVGRVTVTRPGEEPGVGTEDTVETTFAAGALLPPEVVAEARPEQQRLVRPFFLRTLVVGQDGRWSTSKLQALLWTGALLFALLSIVYAELLGLAGVSLADIELPDQYYLLLGGPFAAAIVAKVSTTAKVERGSLIKLTAEDASSDPFRGIKDVISDDRGRTDLFDLQFFAFNLVALAWFFITFAGDVRELPDIPEAVFGLTSASALAYSTKKSLERTIAVVSGISSTTVRRGQQITVWGQNLVIGGEAPQVLVGGHPAPEVTVEPGAGGADTLVVTLPREIAGDVPLVVIPSGGAATTADKALTVSEVAIARVEPIPIRAAPGTRVLVSGSGFGSEEGTVKLAGEPLVVDGWQPDAIVAHLGDVPVAVGESVVLQVTAVGGDVGARAVAVEAMAISTVDPPSFRGARGTRLAVNGSGLARTGLRAQLAGVALSVDPRSDALVIVTLPADLPAGGATLTLSDRDRYSASARVDMTA